jgi:Flp pilus assembly protein CpaB
MRAGRIFVLLGIVLGLGTMLAALFILSSNNKPALPIAVPTVPSTEKVVVAVQPIGEGTKVSPQTVELREVDVSEVPVGAVRNVNQALGKIARVPIYQAQVVEDSMLATEAQILAEGASGSTLIPKGKVAIALPIDDLSSAAYAIQAGDFVDVLITMNFIDVDEQSQTKLPLTLAGANCPGCVPDKLQIPRVTTQLLVQDAQILKVGLWSSAEVIHTVSAPVESGQTPPPNQQPAAPQPALPKLLTVMVNQQDALVIKYARESGASIDLALRSSGDHDVITTEPVTLDYMLARFGIVVPPKRPYTLYTFTNEGKPKESPGPTAQ